MKYLKNIKISEWYYVLAVLAYIATLWLSQMRPGVFGALVMALVAVELIVGKKIRLAGLTDWIAVAFFAYQVVSVIWLLAAGYPLSVYTNEFVSSTLPMVFYLAGKSAGVRRSQWYRMFIFAMLLLGVVGLILYIWAPQFYLDWSYEWSYLSKADAPTMRVRMNSVVGSTCLSFLMVAGMLVGSYYLGNKDCGTADAGSKEKKRMSPVAFAIVSIVACLLFAIMANQRSGLVAAALVIIYVNYLLFFQLHVIPKKYFRYEIAFIVLAFVAIGIVNFDYILKFWYRIISLPTAISERSEQWVAAVNNMYSFWIGNGLGANGHRALGIEGAHVIADGGLIKLYCENGVLGFSLWAYLMYLLLANGVKNIKEYYVEAGILAIGILQSIGSNMLAFQICAPVFWFAAGVLACGGCKSGPGEEIKS